MTHHPTGTAEPSPPEPFARIEPVPFAPLEPESAAPPLSDQLAFDPLSLAPDPPSLAPLLPWALSSPPLGSPARSASPGEAPRTLDRVGAWIVVTVAVIGLLAVMAAARAMSASPPAASESIPPPTVSADGNQCTFAAEDAESGVQRCFEQAIANAGARASVTAPYSTATPLSAAAADGARRATMDLDQLAVWADERAHQRWRIGDVAIDGIVADHDLGVVMVAIRPEDAAFVDAVHVGFASDPRIVVRLVRPTPGPTG